MRMLFAIIVFLSFMRPTVAEAKPSNTKLVLAGVAMGVPTYWLGVAMHEGSHALTGKLLGAQITNFSLIPGFHPKTDKFYFGYVTVRGLRNDQQRSLFLMAPKITDTILLSSFGLLSATGTMPKNDYGKTALLVLATGFWIDFSKDIFAFWNHNDTVKGYNILGLDNEWKRIPARLVHLGLSIAMGYSIVREYSDLLGEKASPGTTSLAIPIWRTPF